MASILTRRTVLLLVPLLLIGFMRPESAAGQSPSREFTADLRPFSVDFALAFPVGSAHLFGFSIGGGPDELNRTLVPSVDPTNSERVTLEQIVRLGPIYRYDAGSRMSVDVGLRLALGGVMGVSGSPELVGGVHSGVFYGWRRLRFGPRLFVGASTGVGSSEEIVHIDWMTARIRIPF